MHTEVELTKTSLEVRWWPEGLDGPSWLVVKYDQGPARISAPCWWPRSCTHEQAEARLKRDRAAFELARELDRVVQISRDYQRIEVHWRAEERDPLLIGRMRKVGELDAPPVNLYVCETGGNGNG